MRGRKPMLKKITPQEAYEAYRRVTLTLKQKWILPEIKGLPPATWGEVSEEDKIRFAEMALRVNSRSEEHTSELQSRQYLVCRLLLEKKKNNTRHRRHIRLHNKHARSSSRFG